MEQGKVLLLTRLKSCSAAVSPPWMVVRRVFLRIGKARTSALDFPDLQFLSSFQILILHTVWRSKLGNSQGLAGYLNAAKEDLFILRRRDILNFIDSQPRDRYGYLRPFLPLVGVQEVENAMKEAREKANRSAENAASAVAQLAEFISKPLGIIGEPTKASLVVGNIENSGRGGP